MLVTPCAILAENLVSRAGKIVPGGIFGCDSTCHWSARVRVEGASRCAPFHAYARIGQCDAEASDVEAEMHDVAVAHHVVLALKAHLAGFLGALLALAGDEIGV